VKPWPEEILKRYPRVDSELYRSRPWWSSTPLALHRRDGRQVSTQKTVTGTLLLRFRTGDELQVEMERIDIESPLPHPGFRVGQIWAREDGSARGVQAFDGNTPIVLAKGSTQTLGVWSDHAKPIPLPSEFCYLIVDLACPWLAPWSPAEEK